VTPESVHIAEVERDTPRGPVTIWFESPTSMLRARPGQFLMLRLSDSLDPFLARPYVFARQRLNAFGALEHGLYIEPDGHTGARLAALQPRNTLIVLGPLGRPLTLQRGARNLLLCSDGTQLAWLLLLAQECVARGVSVTLLLPASAALPSAMLPAEVELQRVGGTRLLETFLELLPWADSAVVSFAPEELPGLGGALRAAGSRRPVWAFVWRPLPCGTGLCGACGVELRRGGRRLICQDGPAMALTDLY
jgi:hypothetical protein